MEGSAINERHPDDVAEADDEVKGFFDDDGDDGEGAGEQEPAAEAEAQEEPEAEDEAPTAAADPTPRPASDGPTEGAEPASSDPAEAEKQRGSAEREYIVFQKVGLTEKVLKALLKAIEDGDSPSPRVGYFELHRATTRNDRLAIAEAYKHHRSTLGQQCELAAVSSRSFKERAVKPREVKPADDIQIV